MYLDDKLKYLLLKIFAIDPLERLDIYSLIEIFENLYNTKVNKYNKQKLKNILYNNNILLKLEDINKYISSRLNYITLTKLDVALSIFDRLNFFNDSKKRHIKFEKEVLKKADLVLTVSESWSKRFNDFPNFAHFSQFLSKFGQI